MTTTPDPDRWLKWAQRIQALSQSGLTYARDPFDIERYETLRELAAEMVAAHSDTEDTSATAARINDLFAGEMGYATPKLDVRGAVFRRDPSDGAPTLLLVKEKSDGGWTLPGGWVDVGESLSEAVEKEVREESGFSVRATKVLGVLDRDKHGHPPLLVHVWKVFVLCQLMGGTALTHTTETEGAEFFREEQIPTLPLSLTRLVPSQVTRLFEHLRNPDLSTDFD